MRQDKATLQRAGELCALRRVPFRADPSCLRDVENGIIARYLGIRYQHRGRSLSGLDCWGLLKLVYGDFGVSLFDVEELRYRRYWGARGHDYFKEYSFHDWIQVAEPRSLDAVLFLNACGVAHHAGLVLSNGRFLHCAQQGVVLGRLNTVRETIEGFYRLKIWS